MSANLLSNKTLSNSVIPFKSQPEMIKVFTTSSDFVVSNWYYSLTAILISGGGGAFNSTSTGTNAAKGGQGGGGAGAIATFILNAKPGDTITAVIGAGGTNNSASLGGTTSISINGASLISITGGSYGGNANQNPGGTSNGSAGGVNGGGLTTIPTSQGAGTVSDAFFGRTSTYATTGTFTLSSAVFTTNTNGYGSEGSIGSGGTYSQGGGGGGAGRSAPGGIGGASNGGYGTILLIPTLTGNPLKYYVCGGGGGGAYGTPGDPGDPIDPTLYSGGLGGSVIDNSTTYYLGGSGGSLSADGVGNFTYSTSATNGAINTGSGGGGAQGGGANGGQGGSGLIILIGQRSYPFSGKPI